jgi:hypothetical protein
MHRPALYLKHYVSEAGFCPRLQVEDPETICLLGPLELVPFEDGDRIQSPKLRLLNKTQDN